MISIPTLLLKFCEKIWHCCRHQASHLQISIEEADRDYLCFLWWENYEKKKIKCPILLGAVLDHHFTECDLAVEK
ncbi:hypothetical protein PR048_020193 [Dryococelus australis]|uniref:Uncharacterized protein n=1 Tax=Dryococelus australis TaxID=614101 RepID=A0ABQ9H5L3_9NEOP|nr:hypothetical protein PR048_020193 [Dryococelus australis]